MWRRQGNVAGGAKWMSVPPSAGSSDRLPWVQRGPYLYERLEDEADPKKVIGQPARAAGTAAAPQRDARRVQQEGARRSVGGVKRARLAADAAAAEAEEEEEEERFLHVLADDPSAQAQRLKELTGVAKRKSELGDHHAALSLYGEALRLADTLGWVRAKALVLNDMGLLYRHTAQYGKAIDLFQGSARTAAVAKDALAEAAANSNLGNVYDVLGQYPRALHYYDAAVALCEVRPWCDGSVASAALTRHGRWCRASCVCPLG
jgi:tetratricopeptide (TPR) repeat protein